MALCTMMWQSVQMTRGRVWLVVVVERALTWQLIVQDDVEV
jgi:hypothetical protein